MTRERERSQLAESAAYSDRLADENEALARTLRNAANAARAALAAMPPEPEPPMVNEALTRKVWNATYRKLSWEEAGRNLYALIPALAAEAGYVPMPVLTAEERENMEYALHYPSLTTPRAANLAQALHRLTASAAATGATREGV